MLNFVVAILFQIKDVSDNLIEVRSAGRSKRLYINKILHTSFNPSQWVTGDIWDSLAISALLAPPEKIQRVLLLGVGGGAAFQILQRVLPSPKRFVGVDNSPDIVKIAQRFFNLNTELIVDDARHAVNTLIKKKERFDMIIDDAFSRDKNEATRAYPITHAWQKKLERLIDPSGGIIVLNLDTDAAQRRVLSNISSKVKSAFTFKSPGALNRITALSYFSSSKAAFYRHISRHIPKAQSKRLKFSLTKHRI